MDKIRVIFLFLVLTVVATSFRDDRVVTIFLIGDSTMANKDTSGGKQERGWGMMLQECFDENIRVENHAVNGRSSLSFINEGRWDRVLEKLRPGDYVVIQFGHNDEKPKPDRHTEPGSTFDANLEKFVRETRERGGIPIMMNAVVRRNFFVRQTGDIDDEHLRTTTFKDGVKMVDGDNLIDTHGLYRIAPRNVAISVLKGGITGKSVASRLPSTWSLATRAKVLTSPVEWGGAANLQRKRQGR